MSNQPQGEITIVLGSTGQCVAVTRNDVDDGHILSIIWEFRPGAAQWADAGEIGPSFPGSLRLFAGWLSGEIPELQKVEIPRLSAAVDKFLSLPAYSEVHL